MNNVTHEVKPRQRGCTFSERKGDPREEHTPDDGLRADATGQDSRRDKAEQRAPSDGRLPEEERLDVLKVSHGDRGRELGQVQAGESDRCGRADQQRRARELSHEHGQDDGGVETHDARLKSPASPTSSRKFRSGRAATRTCASMSNRGSVQHARVHDRTSADCRRHDKTGALVSGC